MPILKDSPQKNVWLLARLWDSKEETNCQTLLDNHCLSYAPPGGGMMSKLNIAYRCYASKLQTSELVLRRGIAWMAWASCGLKIWLTIPILQEEFAWLMRKLIVMCSKTLIRMCSKTLLNEDIMVELIVNW